jgi:hypothetical protein
MDDINEQEIERRLNWFETDVIPAVEYFHYHPIEHKNSSCALGLKLVCGRSLAESV